MYKINYIDRYTYILYFLVTYVMFYYQQVTIITDTNYCLLVSMEYSIQKLDKINSKIVLRVIYFILPIFK